MTKKAIAFCILLLGGMLYAETAFSAEKIYLNSAIREPFATPNKDGFVDLIVREAFARIGVDAEVIVYQDSSKSLSNANSGVDDGAALRIKGIEKQFPNLIMVPEKLMDNDFVAYSMGMDVDAFDWEALNRYSIAYIGGWQIFKNNIKGHSRTTMVKTPQELFDILSELKVDLILFERWQGLWRANELGIHLVSHKPPLASMEMFMYLNKKHKDKVADVAKALANMKKDGTYDDIYNRALGKYLE